jgi:hypothetical protein
MRDGWRESPPLRVLFLDHRQVYTGTDMCLKTQGPGFSLSSWPPGDAGLVALDAANGLPNKIARIIPRAIVTPTHAAARTTRLPTIENCKPIALFISSRFSAIVAPPGFVSQPSSNLWNR